MSGQDLEHFLAQKEFNNWVKGALFLKYLADGLLPFLQQELQNVHRDILSDVQSGLPSGRVMSPCTSCSPKSLSSSSHPCPARTCTFIREKIKVRHKYKKPSLKNTAVSSWYSQTGYWEVAKCFLPENDGYRNVQVPSDTDCSGLLILLDNCISIHPRMRTDLSAKENVCTEIRALRHLIMHSSRLCLADDKLNQIHRKCSDLLADDICLMNDPDAQTAMAKISEVMTGRVSVSTEDTVAVMRDIDKAIQERLQEYRKETGDRQDAQEERIDYLEKEIQSLSEVQRKVMEVVTFLQRTIVPEVEGLKSRVANAEGETEGVKSRVSNVEGETEGVKSRVANVEGETEGVKSRVANVEGETEGVKSRVANVEGETEGVKSRVANVEGETEGVKSRVANVEGETEGVKSRVANVEGETEGVKSRLANVEGETEGLKSRVANVEGETEGVKSRVANVEGETEGVKSRLANVEGETEGVKSRVAIVEGETEGLKTRVANVEGETEGVKSRLANVEGETEGLKSRVANVEGETEGVKSRVANVKGEIEGVKSRVANAEGETEGVKSRVANVEGETEGVKSRVANVEGETEGVKSRVANVEGEMGDVKGDVDNLKENVRELREERQMKDDNAGTANGRQDENRLKNVLQDAYKGFHTVSVSPLMAALDLERVYTSTVIRENLDHARSGKGNCREKSLLGNILSDQTPNRNRKETEPIESIREIFYDNEDLQRSIYLTGDAGCGKTTLCHHLANVWSRNDLGEKSNNEKDILSVFEYVFFVSLKCADSNQTLLEMICSQLCPESEDLQSTVKHVLKTRSSQCLVLVDGLDEWKGSPRQAKSPFCQPGLPSKIGLHNCTVLTTSRPWKVEALLKGLDTPSRVFEIEGFDERGIKYLSLRILLALGEPQIPSVYARFEKEMKDLQMWEIATVPMMLATVISTWYRHETLDPSLCVNYCNMFELLFERAEEALKDIVGLQAQKSQWSSSDIRLPYCFRNKPFCQEFAPSIDCLSKFAFERLFSQSKENSLVFDKQDLMDRLGKTVYDICLQVGILSQTRALAVSPYNRVSVSFLHSSIQEFLAALWLTRDDSSECLTRAKSSCQSLDDVLEMHMFIRFVCGLNQEKSQLLWDHVVGVANVAMGDARISLVGTVEICRVLQLMSIHCTRESENCKDIPVNGNDRKTGKDASSKHPRYVVPMAFIDPDQNQKIVSNQVLSNLTTLKGLFITDQSDMHSEVLMCLPHMQSLEYISVTIPTESSVVLLPCIVNALCQCRNLKYISLVVGTYIEMKHMTVEMTKPLCEKLFKRLCSESKLIQLDLAGLTLTCDIWPCSPAISCVHVRVIRITLNGQPRQSPCPLGLTYLCIVDVNMSHSHIKYLCSCLQKSCSLKELVCIKLQCTDHSPGQCTVDFDLSGHQSLRGFIVAQVAPTIRITLAQTMLGLRTVSLADVKMTAKDMLHFVRSIPTEALDVVVSLPKYIGPRSLAYMRARFAEQSDGNTSVQYSFKHINATE